MKFAIGCFIICIVNIGFALIIPPKRSWLNWFTAGLALAMGTSILMNLFMGG